MAHIGGDAVILMAGGAPAIAAGAMLGLGAGRTFWNAKTTILPAKPTTAVVAQGPYRFTRNPMYVSMALASVGLSLLLNNAWALLLLPGVLVAVDRLVIRREERYRAARFGPMYRDYCSRVRRWI